MDSTLSKVAREMAGEIYNPVTLIKGYVDLLEKRLKSVSDSAIQQAALEPIIREIQENCRRAAGIAESLQDLVVNEHSDKLSLCTTRQIVDRASALFSEKLKKLGIRIQTKHEDSELKFWCNHLQLVQILACLIVQSIERVEKKTIKGIGLTSLLRLTNEKSGFVLIRIHDSGSHNLQIPSTDFCKQILSRFGGELELMNSSFGACLELRFPIEIR